LGYPPHDGGYSTVYFIPTPSIRYSYPLISISNPIVSGTPHGRAVDDDDRESRHDWRYEPKLKEVTMSVFVPRKVHYDLLVNTMMEGLPDVDCKYRYWEPFGHRYWEPLGDSHDELGELLLRETVRSVWYRYYGNPEMIPEWTHRPYRYVDPVIRLSAIEFIKALQCYRYQSCGHPEWKDSKAETITREALLRTALALIDTRMKGEYEQAPWEWTEEDLVEKVIRRMP
jgi:hypothetical protein